MEQYDSNKLTNFKINRPAPGDGHTELWKAYLNVENSMFCSIEALIELRSITDQIMTSSFDRALDTRMSERIYNTLIKLEEIMIKEKENEKRYSWISLIICGLIEHEIENNNPNLLKDLKFSDLYDRNQKRGLHEISKFLWNWKANLRDKISFFSIMKITQAIAPDEPEVWIQSGELEIGFANHYKNKDRSRYKNHLNIAKRNFEKVLQLNPDSWQALSNLGKMAFEEKNFDVALSYFSGLSKLRDHKNPSYLEYIAQTYEAKEEYEKAIEISENICELSPTAHRYAFLAKLYHQSGGQQKALDVINKIEEMKNSQIEHWHSYYGDLSDAYQNIGLIQEAVRVIKEAIEFGRSAVKEERDTYQALSEFYQRLHKLL